MNDHKLHYIQIHILKVLMLCKWARFIDMKPKKVDSNLYNYHLRLLIKWGLVEKIADKGYRLSPLGLRHIDLTSANDTKNTTYPKVLTKIIAQNQEALWLWPKFKQPFLGSWSLPSGKVHFDDKNIERAVCREISYITDEPPTNLCLKGVIECRVLIEDIVVTHTISHVFSLDINSIKHERMQLIPISKLKKMQLSPGTKETIETSLNEKNYFYKSFDIESGL